MNQTQVVQSSANQIGFSFIDNNIFQTYKSVNFIDISQSKKQSIKRQCMIENSSRIEGTTRIMRNQLYLQNVDNNPFSVNYINKKKQIGEKPSIIDQLMNSKIQSKYHQIQKKQKIQEFHKLLYKLEQIENFIHSYKKRKNIQITLQEQIIKQQLVRKDKKSAKQKIIVPINNIKSIDVTLKNLNTITIKPQQMQIQDIANIKQNRILLHQHETFNIFKLCEKNKLNQVIHKQDNQQYHQQVQSTYQLLKQKHFAFKACHQNFTGNLKNIFFKQISYLSRNILCSYQPTIQQLNDILQPEQVNFKQTQLTFLDLMGFASARITPDAIKTLSNNTYQKRNTHFKNKMAIEPDEDDSQQTKQPIITYKANTLHVSQDHNDVLEEVNEIHQYNLLNLASSQIQYGKLCSALKKKIEEVLNLQKTGQQNNSHDKKNMQFHENNLKAQFLSYLYQTKQHHFYGGDIDKKVKSCKKNKTRKESIALKTLIQTIKYKNNEHNKIYCSNETHKFLKSENYQKKPSRSKNH